MSIRGFLIDLDGVLYVGGRPIPGAADTLRWLEDKRFPFRFVSNTTRKSRASIAAQLGGMGLKIPSTAIFTPATGAISRIRECGGGNVHLITTGDVHREFEEAGLSIRSDNADYVVVGDAGDNFTYQSLTAAFRLVLEGARILALEKDRYWMGTDGLQLSAGPFVAALEYATGAQAEVMGKPSPAFFERAVKALGMLPEEIAMVGDDVRTDTGGAMACGMSGILVKTGKFRPESLRNADTPPTAVIDSVASLPDFLQQ